MNLKIKSKFYLLTLIEIIIIDIITIVYAQQNYSSSSLLTLTQNNNETIINKKQQLSTTIKTTTITTTLIRYYRQNCEKTSDCDSNLICFNQTCRCGLRQVYLKFKNHHIDTIKDNDDDDDDDDDSKGMCIYFEQSIDCKNDYECQDLDNNVICDKIWGRCRCRNGFYLNPKTKYCQKINNHQFDIKQNTHRKHSKSSSSSSSSITTTTKPIRRPQYFRLNTSCQKRSEKLDCSAEYSYCFDRKCKCWPEFEFWEDPDVTLSNVENNSGISSLQLFTKELITLATEHVEHFVHKNDWKIGKCRRKICDTNDDCRVNVGNGIRNTNLICNNTVCECPYGYLMQREQHICMKLIYRRPSCDLTCKIIGGLFASIFVFTLIYWCFYCCMAIVRNFHHHHYNFDDISRNHHHHHYHHRRRRRRYNRHNSQDLIHRRQSLSNSIISFITKFDKPPTYDEVMEDDHEDDDYNDNNDNNNCNNDNNNINNNNNNNNNNNIQSNCIEMKEILPRYTSLWKLTPPINSDDNNNNNENNNLAQNV